MRWHSSQVQLSREWFFRLLSFHLPRFSLVFSCCPVVRFRNSCRTLSSSRFSIREVTDCVSLGVKKPTILSVSLFPSRVICTLWPPFDCVRKLPCCLRVNVYPCVLRCIPPRRHHPLASRATTALNWTLMFPMKPLTWTSPIAPRSCPLAPRSVIFVVYRQIPDAHGPEVSPESTAHATDKVAAGNRQHVAGCANKFKILRRQVAQCPFTSQVNSLSFLRFCVQSLTAQAATVELAPAMDDTHPQRVMVESHRGIYCWSAVRSIPLRRQHSIVVWMIVFAETCSSPHQQCHGAQGASRWSASLSLRSERDTASHPQPNWLFSGWQEVGKLKLTGNTWSVCPLVASCRSGSASAHAHDRPTRIECWVGCFLRHLRPLKPCHKSVPCKFEGSTFEDKVTVAPFCLRRDDSNLCVSTSGRSCILIISRREKKKKTATFHEVEDLAWVWGVEALQSQRFFRDVRSHKSRT